MKRIIYACLFVILFSCKEDDEPIITSELSFISNEDFSESWLVLSDSTGKVVIWKAFSKGEKVTLSYPVTSAKKTITLTHIRRFNSNSHIVRTFTDVAPGDYSFDSPTTPNIPSVGTHKLYLPASSDFGFVYQTDACGAFQTSETEVDFTLCDLQNNLYMWLTKKGNDNEVPHYLLKKIDVNSNTERIDLPAYMALPQMKLKQVSIDARRIGMFLVSGLTTKRSMNASISYFNNANEASATATIYYPDLPTFFLKYSTVMAYSYSNEPKVSYSSVRESTEPSVSNAETVASLGQVKNNSNLKLTLTSSGSSDYFSAFMAYSTGGGTASYSYGTWEVNAPFKKNQEINLPQFPADLLSEVDLSGFNNKTFTNLTFGDEDDLNGYTDFYNRYLKGSGFIQAKNGTAKTYFLN